MNANRLILAIGVVFVLCGSLLVACCPVTPEGPGEREPTAALPEEPTARPTEEEGAPTQAPTDVPEPTAELSPLESPLDSPIEPPPPPDGQVLLQERCTVCHGLERITGAGKSREEWETTVDRMIDKGAELDAEERDVLVDYLTETYGE
jgi:glucose/arabinose dehydrogenase